MGCQVRKCKRDRPLERERWPHISRISRQKDTSSKICFYTISLRAVFKPMLLTSHIKIQHDLKDGWICTSPWWQSIKCLSRLHFLAQEDEFLKYPTLWIFPLDEPTANLFPWPSLPPIGYSSEVTSSGSASAKFQSKVAFWDFPGGPVVKTVHFDFRVRVWSLVWELRSPMLCSAAKKKKKFKVAFPEKSAIDWMFVSLAKNSLVEIWSPVWWYLEVESLAGDYVMRVEPSWMVRVLIKARELPGPFC